MYTVGLCMNTIYNMHLFVYVDVKCDLVTFECTWQFGVERVMYMYMYGSGIINVCVICLLPWE